MNRLLLSRLLALSLILVAAVVGARGKSSRMAGWPAGYELDVRTLCSAGWKPDPDEEAWKDDELCPELSMELCWSRAKWIVWFWSFEQDERNPPPGLRVLCGGSVVIPSPSTDHDVAMDMAALAGVTVDSGGSASDICNEIVKTINQSPFCDP